MSTHPTSIWTAVALVWRVSLNAMGIGLHADLSLEATNETSG